MKPQAEPDAVAAESGPRARFESEPEHSAVYGSSVPHVPEFLEQQLLEALSHSIDAIVVVDQGGRILFANNSYSELFAVDSAALIGRHWLDVEGQFDTVLRHRISRALSMGEAWRGKTEARAGSGGSLAWEVALSPLHGANGELLGCIASKRDLSFRIQLEEQLFQAQKMEAVGQLTGGMAHDFNNLLHVIQGQTQLLEQLTRGGGLHPIVQEIAGATERASRLIAQMLLFSRNDIVELSEFHLAPAVGGVCDMLRPLLGHAIRLEFVGMAERALIRGNLPQLEQVVTNLCINARDAMPEGGVITVSVRAIDDAEPIAELAGRPAAEFVELRVLDEGEGMSSHTQQHLFEPFFTTKERGKGSGLGLAMTNAIVQAHGGAIGVVSEQGRGSEFRIYLPKSVAAVD